MDRQCPQRRASRRQSQAALGHIENIVVAIALLAGALLMPIAAVAHHVTPDEVIQSLLNTGTRQKFDITAAERSPDLPRLLIIRVGPGWSGVYPARRVVAAEEWYQLWRDAVPDGVLGIVDAAERPVVNFDPQGHATLHDAAPATPAR